MPDSLHDQMTQPDAPRRQLRGRPPKYPWAHWLNGERKLLVANKDFAPDVNLESLRTQILHKAKAAGLVVTTELGFGGIVIDFHGDRPDDIDWDALWDGERHDLSLGFPPVYQPWELVAEIYKRAARRGIDADHLQVMTTPGGVAMRAILPVAEREALTTEGVTR